jgi:hypothetical protein
MATDAVLVLLPQPSKGSVRCCDAKAATRGDQAARYWKEAALYSDVFANRTDYGLARGDRERLAMEQRRNFRGVRAVQAALVSEGLGGRELISPPEP